MFRTVAFLAMLLYLKGKHTFSHRKDRSDIDIALGLYRQAIKMEPTLLSARVGVAEVLMHLNDFTQAERELQSALVEAKERNLKPDQQNILCLLSRYYINHSNWSEACRCTGEALEIVRAINHPRLKILYDVYHMQIMEGNVLAMIERLLPWIGHFHAAGVPGRGELFGSELNYPEILRFIESLGYEGTFGLEYFPKMADHDASLCETLEYLSRSRNDTMLN